MKKSVVILFLLFFSKSAFSTWYYYANQSAAYSACLAYGVGLIGGGQIYGPYDVGPSNCPNGANGRVAFITPYISGDQKACTFCASGDMSGTPDATTGNVITCPPSGEQRKIQVQTSTSSGAAILFVGSSSEAVFNNCKYDFAVSATQGSVSDCYKQGVITYCNVYATSKGVTDTVATPAPVVQPSDVLLPKSTVSGCSVGVASDGKAVDVCPSSQSGGASSVNGVPVKPTSSGAQINGVDVTPTSPKNCGTVNGQYTCIASSSDATFSTSSGGTVTYWKFRPESQTSETTQTNPDGSVTKTETTTDNVIGSVPYVKTTVIGTNGTSTTTITGGQVGSSSQTDSAALQSIAKGVSEMGKGLDLSTVNKNTGDTAANTKAIKEKLDSYFGPAPEMSATGVLQGLDSAISSDQASLLNMLDPAAANPFSSLLPAPGDFIPNMLPSASSCTSAAGIHAKIFGKWDFNFEPCEKLQPLREVLAWVFAVLAMLDILKITFRGQT